MELIEYPDREMLAIGIADLLAGQLTAALHHEDSVTLVVPGGTTPQPVFEMLRGLHLDWDRVKVLLSDERWVGEGDARSNTGLVKAHLLQDLAAAATYVPLYAPADTPADSAARVVAGVAGALPVTVALVGMGADMHTASLFPGDPGLAAALAADAPAVLPMQPPTASEPRLTLSAAALKGAMHLHIVISGAEKRAALHAAQTLPPETAPVAALLPGATVHWAP